ncbi:MAG TPA: VTT domain-containing protein [Legionella sp.]|nr:VTT domain-containing protein [Legionella sp.]
MNLFVDYVQPLTDWLQANPRWSLFITFFISLAESLAIIGSIVPGSVTMTAIGILAGSGIMRIDLTLIAASLGAICGDSLSYAIGYIYSDRLVEIWPFRKYPGLLKYGKDYFERHGGKSVLIGRFVGPLRSIIPVIAGIMHMKQWRFLFANVISAIGWSILYVMPGVLIGAAGHELSTETATRLFIIILIFLSAMWLLSILLKSLFISLQAFFKKNLHLFWLSLKNSTLFKPMFFLITPEWETNHYHTAGLILLTLFYFTGSFLLIFLTIYSYTTTALNLAVHLLMQSFHTSLLENFFIILSQTISFLTMMGLYFICCLWFIYHKNLKIILYFTSLFIASGLIGFLLTSFIPSPRPPGLLVTMPGNSFPDINLMVATAFYGFIFFYINNKDYLLTYLFRSLILVILSLSGLGALYLGDYWLTDILGAYFIGATLCLLHYIAFRKWELSETYQGHSNFIFGLFIAGLILITTLSVILNFKTLVYNHTPYQQKYTINKSHWWNQQQPILPLYRLNRIGKRISLFNIQYDGSIANLKHDLLKQGWETHSESFFTKLIMLINNDNNLKLPLLTQLHENRRPELIMTLNNKETNSILMLTIWESSYRIQDLKRPIWVGSLHQLINDSGEKTSLNLVNEPLSFIVPALKKYQIRRVLLPDNLVKPTTFPATPYIFLIEERMTENTQIHHKKLN